MRALVLSGGGVKGAYQVGALEYLVKEKNRQYDILCGVSVGALNVSFISMFSKYKEYEAIEKLKLIWRKVKTDKIYKNWFPFGKVHSVWKNSLYNSKPLQLLVSNNTRLAEIRNSGRLVRVGAVCLETGEYRLFGQQEDCFIDAVLASSAFPIMFCPVIIEGKAWVDGGIKQNTPIQSAIDLGATKIDVVVCEPENTNLYFDTNTDVLRVVERTINLVHDGVTNADLLTKIKLSNKSNIEINIIRPKSDLTNSVIIFDQQEIRKMIHLGYQDAKYQSTYNLI